MVKPYNLRNISKELTVDMNRARISSYVSSESSESSSCCSSQSSQSQSPSPTTNRLTTDYLPNSSHLFTQHLDFEDDEESDTDSYMNQQPMSNDLTLIDSNKTLIELDRSNNEVGTSPSVNWFSCSRVTRSRSRTTDSKYLEIYSLFKQL